MGMLGIDWAIIMTNEQPSHFCRPPYKIAMHSVVASTLKYHDTRFPKSECHD